MARDKDITSSTYRVLFVLLATATEGGDCSDISQAKIAAELSMAPQNVNRAIKLLVTKGIISQRVLGGKLVGYRINEFFGAKQ